MVSPQHPDADPSSSAQEPSAPTEEIRADHLLLERLKNEPPVKEQLHPTVLIAIIIIVLALGTVVYFAFRQPEKFAENPHAQGHSQGEQAQADSSEVLSKRLHLAPLIDSLHKILEANPNDPKAHLEYANVLYEAELWGEAKSHYEFYLKTDPKATDARIDYAFVIVQTTQDFKRGLAEIEKALAIDPEHVKGLFNAGLFSVQAFDDRKEGIMKSENYFRRSRAAAEKKGETEMVTNIDRVLEEIDKIKTQTSR
ncbi:MAG TPA: hypothetical protein VFO76_12605 [Candidatus Kapabacteria bacterium]|nr:hypothetical protein [Candidatus Kapabacteria bacterium]